MRQETCKHYRGMAHHDTCEAGVNMRQLVGGDDYGWGARLPCHCPSLFKPNGPVPECSKREFPTPEEIAKEEAEIAALFESTDKARAAIVGHLGGPWKRGMPGLSGRIDCPVCGGKESLRFSRSGYNGHIHAGCETEGCVRWME